MKIKIGKSDKLSVPGVYESTGTSLEVEFEIPDDEMPSDKAERDQLLGKLKEQFESIYWPLVNWDFQTYLQRIRMGTEAFINWKNTDN